MGIFRPFHWMVGSASAAVLVQCHPNVIPRDATLRRTEMHSILR